MDRDPLIGRVIGNYHLHARIGSGGFAAVYRGRRLTDGHPVAVKVLHRKHRLDVDLMARFELEARLAARVRHPNVAQIFELAEADGLTYMAMELVKGRDLRWLLDGSRRLCLSVAVTIMDQLLDGLAAAHAADIVHGDLKPENVLLSFAGSRRLRVKLVDFGVASPTGQEPADSIAGTPAYMAPELLCGLSSTASDIYSAGILFYEMLTGAAPFNSDDAADLLRRQAHSHAPRLQRAPPAVCRVLERALRKQPAGRWPSANAMRTALLRAHQPAPARSRRPVQLV